MLTRVSAPLHQLMAEFFDDAGLVTMKREGTPVS
jgi:hypothetical protein